MPTAIQRRRGTTTEHAVFTGLAGELTIDTTKNTAVVHNGVAAGGFPLASSSTLAAAGGATLVGNTPAGNIAATTVQAALNELDSEKAALAGAAFTGALSYTGTLTGDTGVVNLGSGQVFKDASGNVGIGTASPGAKLDVNGAALIQGMTVGRGGGAFATNTAVGVNALVSNTTGVQNTASGFQALYYNTTGNYNTASGFQALLYNTTGINNTASGYIALYSNTTGINNTASGYAALYSNTTGSNNTASGGNALTSNTTGNYNTASGLQALTSNTTGNYNTASGYVALTSNTTGSGNSALNPMNSAGAYAPVFNPTTENDRFCMGSTGVTNAYIQVAWTVVSDARDKTDFAAVPHGLAFVTQLQPTAYRYKMNRDDTVGHGPLRYGFKAQEVLALEGDTPVIVDAEDADKLRFNDQAMLAVLVNAIKEQQVMIESLKTRLAAAGI